MSIGLKVVQFHPVVRFEKLFLGVKKKIPETLIKIELYAEIAIKKLDQIQLIKNYKEIQYLLTRSNF